eukprot:5224669-Prymnesium_polylepis.1
MDCFAKFPITHVSNNANLIRFTLADAESYGADKPQPEPPAKWARTDGARPCGGGQQKEPHSRPRGIVTAEDLQLIQVETRLKQAAGAGVQTDLSGRTRTGLVRTDLSVFRVEMMHEVMFIGVVGML